MEWLLRLFDDGIRYVTINKMVRNAHDQVYVK